MGLALLGALGGDDDDAVGGLCTVDGGRGSILQHLDGLHVVAVEDRTHILAGHHSVNHVERTVGIAAERRGTANRRVGAQTARCTIGGDVHTGHTALQRLDDIARGDVGHVLHLHYRNGTREVRLFLGRVAYHNHFAHRVADLLQFNYHLRGGLHGRSLISYIGNDKVASLGYYQGKLAAKVGAGGIGPFHRRYHTGPNHGLRIGGRNHGAFHRDVLGLHCYGHDTQP